jgi:hypothetical protein
MKKTTKDIEDCVNRLLKSDKPRIIIGSFNDINELTDEQLKHFDTAEYIWNMIPQTNSGPYKDKFMGVLMDESLKYVHIVFGSEQFLHSHLSRCKKDEI